MSSPEPGGLDINRFLILEGFPAPPLSVVEIDHRSLNAAMALFKQLLLSNTLRQIPPV